MNLPVVAVTGAGGFIGRALCADLTERGWSVIPVRRMPSGEPEALPVGVDVVIHLAARAHVLHDAAVDPAAAFREANLVYTQRVATAAAVSGVRRFVYVSSAGVLGSTTSLDGVDDEAPVRPHDPYTVSKLAAEEWLTASHLPIDLVVVRPPLVYGPGARGNFGRLLRAVRAGWPLPLGAVDAPRSLIGLRNLCDALATVAVHPAASGNTFLVADRETTGVAALLKLIGRLAGRRPFLVPIPSPVLVGCLRLLGRDADIARLTCPFVLRPSRIGERLGWTPRYSLEEELVWALSQA